MSNGDDSYSSCDYINLAYDPANSDKSAKALIYALRPDWESSDGDVEFVRFKEGITNSVSLNALLEVLTTRLRQFP